MNCNNNATIGWYYASICHATHFYFMFSINFFVAEFVVLRLNQAHNGMQWDYFTSISNNVFFFDWILTESFMIAPFLFVYWLDSFVVTFRWWYTHTQLFINKCIVMVDTSFLLAFFVFGCCFLFAKFIGYQCTVVTNIITLSYSNQSFNVAQLSLVYCFPVVRFLLVISLFFLNWLIARHSPQKNVQIQPLNCIYENIELWFRLMHFCRLAVRWWK